jgi:hypothetical protein
MGWCTVGKHGTHLERDGTRGTRSHDVDDVVEGPYTVSGQITVNPTNTELNLLETYIIGASGTVDEVLSNFSLVVDRGNGVYTYAGCKISRASYSGRQGELLTLTCDVIGTTEAASGSRPSEPSSTTPFAFDDIALTLAASSREVKGIEMVIDNAMVPDRFNHNQTVIDQPETDRNVTLQTVHDWSSNTSGLYGQAVGGASGTLVLNDGTNSRTYTYGKLQVPDESPPIQAKGPIDLTLNMVARKDGATKEIART